jgi:hypothetical protein
VSFAVALAVTHAAAAQDEAFRDTPLGTTIRNRKLPTLDGRSESFLGTAKANVFVFFRSEQDRSDQALRQLATLEKEFAEKSVRFVGIVSSEDPRDAVQATVRDTGVKMPVLVDQKDALYGEIGVELHPSIGIADAKQRLVAYQPYRRVNLLDVMRGRIQLVLGEITQAQFATIFDPPVQTVAVNRAHARVKLSRALFQAGDLDGAVQSARAAVALDPAVAENHVVLAEMLARAGSCDESGRENAEAHKLDASAPAPPACAKH